MFCIIVMAGPENADVNSINMLKLTIAIQKLGCKVAIPMSGTAAALPIMQIRALVKRFLLSYLSAIIPPMSPDIRPTTERITEFTKEYCVLYVAKTFKKNTGK